MRYYLLLILFLLCFISCDKKPVHNVTRGIYYWKTVYNPTPYEKETLSKLQSQTIYLRLFDVDWNDKENRAVPLGPVIIKQAVDSSYKYVPVIFITQKTLTQLSADNTASLARSISNLAMDVCHDAGIQYDEVQIDCDWTSRTKTEYFELLNALKKEDFFTGKELSATIRMHQLKYISSSGVPPVQRGLLMCYNLGNISKIKTTNSILDFREAKKYLDYTSHYPLHLDVALPLFGWCLLFRDNAFRGILRDVQPSSVMGNALFERKGDSHFVCIKDVVWNGYSLYKGDVLRLEEPAVKDILHTAAYTSQKIKNEKLHVVLFHCDSLTLKKYSVDDLEAMYSAYH